MYTWSGAASEEVYGAQGSGAARQRQAITTVECICLVIK